MNKFLTYLMITAFIMVGVPWVIVSFVKGEPGTMAIKILLYGVYPLYSFIVGLYAGKNAKVRFLLPVLTAAFFLGGVWMFFEWGEPVYKMYAAGYLILGVIGMLMRAMIRHYRRGKQDETSV